MDDQDEQLIIKFRKNVELKKFRKNYARKKAIKK